MGYFDYQYDERALLPEIKKNIDIMYPASDDKNASDLWVSTFAKEASVWKNGKGVSGSREVLKKLIIDSFSGVKARTHNVDKVFVLGIHAWEVMVDGTTDYEFDDGTKKVGKWASRQKYVDDNGELKIKEYQVQFVWCE